MMFNDINIEYWGLNKTYLAKGVPFGQSKGGYMDKRGNWVESCMYYKYCYIF